MVTFFRAVWHFGLPDFFAPFRRLDAWLDAQEEGMTEEEKIDRIGW